MFCQSCLVQYFSDKRDAYNDIRPDYIPEYDYISRPPVLPQDLRILEPHIRFWDDMSEAALDDAGITRDHIERYEDYCAKVERYIDFLDRVEFGPLYTCPYCAAPVSFIIVVMYLRA